MWCAVATSRNNSLLMARQSSSERCSCDQSYFSHLYSRRQYAKIDRNQIKSVGSKEQFVELEEWIKKQSKSVGLLYSSGHCAMEPNKVIILGISFQF